MLQQPSTSFSELETSWNQKKDNNDVLYLLYRDEQSEVNRLYEQHNAIRLMNGGNFKAPVEDKLQNGARVLDSACGPGAWSVDMGKRYPKSTFQGIDLTGKFPGKEKPENCTYMVHDATKPLPFPDNHFDYIYQRFLIVGIAEKDWPTVISNLMRVLKPGGYIELLESMIPDIINCGPKYGLLSEAAKYGALEKGIRLTLSRDIEQYLNQAGAINIHVRPLAFPIGYGGPGGEFWGKANMANLFRHQFRPMVVKRHPELENPEEYDQFVHEAIEECIEYKSSMLIYNIYAQKPYN